MCRQVAYRPCRLQSSHTCVYSDDVCVCDRQYLIDGKDFEDRGTLLGSEAQHLVDIGFSLYILSECRYTDKRGTGSYKCGHHCLLVSLCMSMSNVPTSKKKRGSICANSSQIINSPPAPLVVYMERSMQCSKEHTHLVSIAKHRSYPEALLCFSTHSVAS